MIGEVISGTVFFEYRMASGTWRVVRIPRCDVRDVEIAGPQAVRATFTDADLAAAKQLNAIDVALAGAMIKLDHISNDVVVAMFDDLAYDNVDVDVLWVRDGLGNWERFEGKRPSRKARD